VYRLGTYALLAGTVALVLLGGWLPEAWMNVVPAAAVGVTWCGLLVVAALRWTRFRSLLDEAFRMEALVGGLNSRLISAWDFLGNGVQSPLVAAVVRRAAEDLKLDFEARLDRRERDLHRKRFFAALLIFVATGLTPWFGFAVAGESLWRSWLAVRERLYPVAYQLDPSAGTHVFRLGQRVEVGITFSDPPTEGVRLVRTSGEQVESLDLALDDSGRACAVMTSDVEAELTVHFEFGQRESEPVVLVFTSPPSLVNMQTELIYPGYTRLLPRSLEGVQQRLVGLSGTRMVLGFTFSKELEEAAITWIGEDAKPLVLETSGRFATVELLHQRVRQASLQVRDRHGFALESPLVIDFEVQEDEKPQVLLPRHLKEDMPLLEAGAQAFSFGVQAQDDYGVTRVVLKWQKSGVDSPGNVLDRGEVERTISPVQRKVIVNFEKVFAGLGLKPGDKVGFQVEAYDNLSPGAAQRTASRRCSLFVYQDALGGLTVRELGFGSDAEQMASRIPKSRRATDVKAPESLRVREQVRNEFQADVTTSTQAPVVHGEFGQATRDYFRLMSTVKYPEEKPATKGGDEGRVGEREKGRKGEGEQ
jgi:hypothetical protein